MFMESLELPPDWFKVKISKCDKVLADPSNEKLFD